jgi:hypothetical protein
VAQGRARTGRSYDARFDPSFRNVGSTTGKVLVFIEQAGFEKYLEEISSLSMPEEISQLLAVSERYGISYPS